MADLQALADWVSPLLAALTPQARVQLARKVGQALRATQARRIRAQANPDGSAYEPRKPQSGKPGTLRAKAGAIKGRRAMFEKLRLARYMRVTADANAATVGFVGRVARIASVHQRGEADAAQPGGPVVRYPVRELLGFTPDEIDNITETLLAHLTGPGA